MKTHTLPTGFLFTDDYSRGQLETLSIGDYGKQHNVKADFLGYHRELNGVENRPIMPLSEKWVITLSTQFGCPQKCNFCMVPSIKFKGNASFDDMKKQLYSAISLFPDVKYTDRLNIHFARMGEPIYNDAVLELALWLLNEKMQFQTETGLRAEVIHPVFTTSLPRRFAHLKERIDDWVRIKQWYYGQAGLQFSINSTNDEQRQIMFGGESITLKEFATIADQMEAPLGRKYCLNFAYSTDFEIDAKKLVSMFDPDKFMCKITPIHNNDICRENNIATLDGYTSYNSYRRVEEELKAAGFDVLVFVPSMDEEDSTITCGNLVLGGSTIKNELSVR